VHCQLSVAHLGKVWKLMLETILCQLKANACGSFVITNGQSGTHAGSLKI
jgi:hypothetical protein